MTSPLIGIGGYLTAGKDVLADRLASHHGYRKQGMSDPLADALYVLNPIIPVGDERPSLWRKYGWNHHTPYQIIVDTIGYTEAKTIPEVRRLLQTLGTEVGRNILGEDTWVKAAEKKILENAKPTALTGIRYPNELTMIKRNFGILVWVDRPGVTVPERSHSSESTLSPEDFDITILNEGTIEDFHHAIDEWAPSISPRRKPDFHWPIYDH